MLTVAVLAVAILLLWAGAVGLDRVTPFAQLTAFRLQLAALALVAGLVLALTGALLAGALLVAVALSPLPQLVGRVRARGAPAGPGAQTLTVLVANVQADRGCADAVARLAARHQADVVMLIEASVEYAQAVVGASAAAGVDYLSATNHPRTALSHDEQCPSWCGASTSLLVRRALRPAYDRARPMGTMGCLSAQVHTPTLTLTVAAVHPLPPTPQRGWVRGWREDHLALGELCASPRPVVIGGDFNATLDHSPLRGLLRLGCRDAAREAGRGLVGTWPAAAPWFLRIPLDHVLLTHAAGAVAGHEVLDVPGTDHRCVVTVLALPEARGGGRAAAP